MIVIRRDDRVGPKDLNYFRTSIVVLLEILGPTPAGSETTVWFCSLGWGTVEFVVAGL